MSIRNKTFKTPLLHKHTKNLELKDSISIAVDRIHRGFEPLKQKIKEMYQQVLIEDDAKLIIYQAFLDRNIRGVPRHLMPMVHDHYFHPKHEAFYPRNLWSLSNAFTSAFKKLSPIKQFEVTARLGTYLTKVQETFQEKKKLEPNFPEEKEFTRSTNLSAALKFSQMNQNQPINNYDYEDIDEDDFPDDSDTDEAFDQYFDEEAESEAIDEATERLIEEYERKAA